MKIIKIMWLSNEEAVLTVNDGMHNFVIFSHPCTYKEADPIVGDLYPFNVRNFMLSNSRITRFDKMTDDKFSYKIVAVVTDVKMGLVTVGNVILNFNEPLPSWAHVGEYIEFECSRIDT